MNARLILALAMLAASPALAAAQPQISPSDMAGRERERFIDSPVERYMKPGPYVAPQVLDTAPSAQASRRSAAKPRKRR